MNNNRHFDDHINDQFGNYTPDVPPHIWENIIAEKDRKRPVGFWVSMFNNRNKLLLLGLVIALSSGGAWLYYGKVNIAEENIVAVDDVKKINNQADIKNDIPTNEISLDKLINKIPLNNNPVAANDIYAGSTTASNAKANTRVSIASPVAETDAGKDYITNNTKGNKKYYTGLGNVLVNTTTPDTDTNGEYLFLLLYLIESAALIPSRCAVAPWSGVRVRRQHAAIAIRGIVLRIMERTPEEGSAWAGSTDDHLCSLRRE